jgi:hypothetical protein
MSFRHLALACGLAVASPATAHELVTPPAIPYPLPQGLPYVVEGEVPHPVITLRFAIIDGQRVLLDPETGRVVHILSP